MIIRYALQPSLLLITCKQNFVLVITTPEKIIRGMSGTTKVYQNSLEKMFNFRKLSTHSTSTVTDLKSDPIVSVSQGQLKGAVKSLYDGTPYYSFKGIPYAQPPVGNLRFKAPLPPNSWNGIYDATEHGPMCPQFDMTTANVTDGDENCLFLNIYTKSLTAHARRPVMFYIHGGAFMSGSGNSELYGPEYLLEHDVVLVTVNYRLEALGFLCLDTEEVPGNAGMKDQVAALKWVQNNIVKFGGDPENVTLFGESAGGASVTYHMASPMSEGLFHKAIVQSGVFLSDWAQGRDAKQRAFRLGKVLNKDTENATELLDYLRSVPANDLVKSTFRTMTVDEKRRGLPIHFAPVVEKKFDNVEPFLCEEPIGLLLQGKLKPVPVLIGYNSAEGLMMLQNNRKKIDFLNKSPHYKVPREIARKVSENTQIELGKRIKKYYFGDKEITEAESQNIAALESDLHFKYGTHLFLHFLSRKNVHAFMYRFDYVSELNFMKTIMGLQNLEVACHADELFYLFRTMMTSDIYEGNKEVREKVRVMTEMWTNFAKTGNPTPDECLGVKWTPYTHKSKEYMNLNDSLSMGRYADQENMEFWNKIYSESGLPCMTKSSL